MRTVRACIYVYVRTCSVVVGYVVWGIGGVYCMLFCSVLRRGLRPKCTLFELARYNQQNARNAAFTLSAAHDHPNTAGYGGERM